MTTPAEFFEQMAVRIDPAKIQGLDATFQFHITGDGGGAWFATFVKGQPEVNRGTLEHADMTLTTTAETWADIVNGTISGQMAFLTGKLRIEGDLTLAIKLNAILG